MTKPTIQQYKSVQQRIFLAKKKFNRQENIALIAVSKTKTIAEINIIAEQGQTAFGENYVQEAIEKMAIRPDLDWHFIGPIQSNKTKSIAENFNWVHSVDRLKIAERLNNQRPKNLDKLNILLSINISEEKTKAGFLKEEVLAVIPDILKLTNLRLKGLMAIPKQTHDFNSQRLPFKTMKNLLNQLQAIYPNESLDTLSMGMSNDLEAAIAEGATMVRIGTDIFGAKRP